MAAPLCVGAKVKDSAQSLFAASELPHPLLASTNGAETLTLVIGIAACSAILHCHLQSGGRTSHFHVAKVQCGRRTTTVPALVPFRSALPSTARPPDWR